MRYISRLILIIFIAGIGAGAGWIFERGGIFRETHPSASEVNSAIGEGIFQAFINSGIKREWISVREEKDPESEWSRRIWNITVPADLPFAVVSLEITRAVRDSGGCIISGRETPNRRRLLIAAGLPGHVSDSLIVTKDGTVSHRKGLIALIIDDFGYERTETVDGFLKFPAKIACAVIPGHPDSRRAAEAVLEGAYELIIHLPLEAKGRPPRDEPMMVKTGLPAGEARRRVAQALDELPGGSGVNNHMGSKATEDAALMGILAEELKRRNLYFVDSRTTAGSIAYHVMERAELPALSRDIFLDHRSSERFIVRQVERLEMLAAERGYAVGIAHATGPLSLEILSREALRLMQKGYEFVFPSDLLKEAKKRAKNF